MAGQAENFNAWPAPCFENEAFLKHQSRHFVSLRSETSTMATHVSGSKWVQSTELDIVNGLLCNFMYVGSRAGVKQFTTGPLWAASR